MDSNIWGALIGVVGAGVLTAIPILYKRRQDRNLQLYKLAYFQVVHLAGSLIGCPSGSRRVRTAGVGRTGW
jgi:hypothetical protein